MILNERDIQQQQALQAACQMMTAARTAPKGKGFDLIETVTITAEDIHALSKEMLRLQKENGLEFFLRDAENILSAAAVVLIGTRSKVQGLNCLHCGYNTCVEKPDSVPCAINSIDVGIAIGSACAMAAQLCVDTRVMFSAGLAAQKLGILGKDCGSVLAIPISISSKNPFFDRKPKEEK